MYVVTCVTGRTGAKVARLLLEAGRKVRVVVRREEAGAPWKARGAEVAVADYADEKAMAAAFRGAVAAYVIPPPLPVTATGHHAYRTTRTASVASALATTRVPYVVSLSSFAAQHPEGTGMIKSCFACERILDAVDGASVTHLRPAFFLENWAAQMPAVLTQGLLPSFLGPADRKFTMVGTADIATTAARLMLEPVRGRRVVELTGTEDYSVVDIARAFSRLLGRQVEPVVYPVEGMAKYLAANGFSEETAQEYQELFAAMMAGHVALEGKVPLERGAFGLSYTLGTMLSTAAS
jgi:uncharacterized protein YbjT (DUF2867 family)